MVDWKCAEFSGVIQLGSTTFARQNAWLFLFDHMSSIPAYFRSHVQYSLGTALHMISDFFLTQKHYAVLRIFRMEICVSIFPYIKNPMIRPIAGTRETTERMMNNHNGKQHMVYCNRGKEEHWIDFANTTMRSRKREIWAGWAGNAQITQLPGPAMTYRFNAHGRISGNSDAVSPSLLSGVQITCR
jgi:hypothetical protein